MRWRLPVNARHCRRWDMQAVATRLLFVTVTMPLAALLALMLLVGFAAGVLAALKVGRKSK